MEYDASKASNVFAGISIDPSKLKLDLLDKRSVISSKSDGKHMSKKDKRKLRHEAFMHKLEASKQARSKAKQKKKPAPLALGSLQDALPTLDLLCRKAKVPPPKEKPRSSRSFHTNQKLLLQDLQHMEKVVNHEQFKANPLGAVLTHLRHTMQQQHEEVGK